MVAETPSVVFHYPERHQDETAASGKTDAIFRAAKKDLLTLMKLDVSAPGRLLGARGAVCDTLVPLPGGAGGPAASLGLCRPGHHPRCGVPVTCTFLISSPHVSEVGSPFMQDTECRVLPTRACALHGADLLLREAAPLGLVSSESLSRRCWGRRRRRGARRGGHGPFGLG